MSQDQPPPEISRCHRYFCYICGSLLPSKITSMDSFQCKRCSTHTYLSWFVGMNVRFGSERKFECEISNNQTFPLFEKLLADAVKAHKAKEALRAAGEIPDTVDLGGPSVKRDCPYCGNNTMTYVTMQLRAADEGQTVIYTCTECKQKEVENT